MHWCEVDTSVGRLLLAADAAGLRTIHFQSGPRPRLPVESWIHDRRALEPIIRQLEDYFEGRRLSFDLPLAPVGTPFQRAVWQQLQLIPYGEIITYRTLARRIGNERACRAVGLANGSNPIPIVIPCHRVVGSNGSLTGFGGGLAIKQQLLTREGVPLEGLSADVAARARGLPQDQHAGHRA